MDQTHLLYHKSIPPKGIYINSVKLLLVSSIHCSGKYIVIKVEYGLQSTLTDLQGNKCNIMLREIITYDPSMLTMQLPKSLLYLSGKSARVNCSH